MKNMRVLSVLLLSALLLVSCGTAADDSSLPAAVKQTEADGTSAAETTEAPAEYQNPGVNYDGATFTFLDYDTEDYFWHAATYCDIRAEDENGDAVNDAQYRRNLTVEELLGVSIATHPVPGVSRNDNWNQYSKMILAGEDSVDAGFVFGSEVTKLLADPSMTLDLYDIDTLDLSASWWDAAYNKEMTIAGTLHSTTGDISIYKSFGLLHLFFSKQLVEDYDLGDLYAIVRDGTWTSEKMIAMCETVASDLNGDGVMDENDQYGMALQTGCMPDMSFGMGVRFTERNSDGAIVPATNNPHTVSVVERLVPFMNNADVNNIAGNFTKKYSNVFYELHIPLFRDNRLLFNYNQLLIAYELREMEADYGILPWAKYDETQEDYIVAISRSWATFLSVPVTNTRLDMTGHVLDAMGYYSQQTVTPAFIDTTVTTKSLRDDDSAEILGMLISHLDYDIGDFYDWGTVRSMFANLASGKSTDFSSAYAKIESKILTAIDDTMAALGE